VRILHVTEASWAGTLQVVRSLAVDQAAQGHSVTLAYSTRPELPEGFAASVPAEIELVPVAWQRGGIGAQVNAGRTLRRIARERRPQLIHLHSSLAGAVGALSLPRDAPLIYSPHGLAFTRQDIGRATAAAVRAVEAFVVRRCALVGAVSEAEATLVRDGLRARRVAVVHNGIPELDDGVPERSLDRAEPVVVALGRIAGARRPAATARILSALRPDARVGWIGGWADGDDDVAVREAGIPVTGWLPRDEALERLAEATVYLHWSAWDGMSLAILEAIARDVVVVASDIPANREIVGARQVCADERSAIQLARSVLEDPALRAELLEEQRRRAPAFGARRMSAEWLAVYERTLTPVAGARMQTATSALAARKIGEPWT
jgi:glycosyltransferase involved in cell wall biosynthesis